MAETFIFYVSPQTTCSPIIQANILSKFMGCVSVSSVCIGDILISVSLSFSSSAVLIVLSFVLSVERLKCRGLFKQLILPEVGF